MNNYEILGLSKTATEKEIKAAYKKLAKRYHPDVYQGDKQFAIEKMQSINDAYSVLSDPKFKKEYDDSLNKPEINYEFTEPTYNQTNSYNNTNNFYNTYKNYTYQTKYNKYYDNFASHTYTNNTVNNIQNHINNFKIKLVFFLISFSALVVYVVVFFYFLNSFIDSPKPSKPLTNSINTTIVKPEPSKPAGNYYSNYISQDYLKDLYNNSVYKDVYSSYSEFEKYITSDEVFKEFIKIKEKYEKAYMDKTNTTNTNTTPNSNLDNNVSNNTTDNNTANNNTAKNTTDNNTSKNTTNIIY